MELLWHRLPARDALANAPILHCQGGLHNGGGTPAYVGHCKPKTKEVGVKLHLVALILGGKGVAEAQPGRRKGGVHGGGLAKVLPRAVKAADGLVVAPHAKPGHSMLRVVLHQPGSQKHRCEEVMQGCGCACLLA